MSLSLRKCIGIGLLALSGMSGCSCDEEPEVQPTLAFFSPAPGSRLDLSADKDNDPSNGVQVDLVLRATHADGGTVTVDNEASSSDPAPGTVAAGKVTFANFTLQAPAAGATAATNSVKATLTHEGKTVTVSASYTVTMPSGPRCRFNNLDNATVLTAAQDVNENVGGFQYNVVMTCAGLGVEAGQAAQLVVRGSHQTEDGVLGSNGEVTFPEVNLPEGAVHLDGSIQIGDETSGAVVVDFTVDTGACAVDVTAPANGSPILAAQDQDGNTANIADIDVSVASSNCGSGSTVVLSVLGQPGSFTGSLDDQGQATIRTQLPQGNQAFDVTIDDATGTKTQGRSLRQHHQVDTVAPVLTLVRPAHDSVLGLSDDQDNDPVNGLQVLVQLRLSNGDDVAGVQFAVNAEAQGGLVAADEFSVIETTLRLNAGEQSLQATAIDDAGNQAVMTWTVTVDMVIPVVTMVAPAEDVSLLADADHDVLTEGFQVLCQLQTANFAAISGRSPKAFCEHRYAGQDGNFTGSFVRSGLVDLDGEGNASVVVTLSDGRVELRAGVATENGQGNSAVSAPARVLTIDGNPPTLSFLNPIDGAALQSTVVSLEIRTDNAEAGQPLTITVNDVDLTPDPAPVAVLGGSTFIEDFDLSNGEGGDGVYVLGASVSDLGGNLATAAAVTVSVDSAVPEVTVLGLNGAAGHPERSLEGEGAILAAGEDIDLDWGGDLDDGFQYGFRVEVPNEAVGTQVQLSINDGVPHSTVTTAVGEDPARRLADFTNGETGLLMPDGTNRLEVTVTDGAGNQTVVRYGLTVITGNLYVRIITPADGTRTNAPEIAVTGSTNVPEGTTCTLQSSNGEDTVSLNTDANANGFLNWDAVSLRTEGEWPLSVSCLPAGQDAVNTQVPTRVTIDRTGPTLSFSGMPEGNIYNLAVAADSTQGGLYRKNISVVALVDNACSVDGINPSAQLTVAGDNVDASYNSSGFNNCTFTFSNVALSDELNDAGNSVTLTVSASDAAGNSAQQQTAVTVDRVGPSVTLSNLADNAILGSDEDVDNLGVGLQFHVETVISGFADGSQATLSDNNQQVRSQLARASTVFSAVNLSDGTHSLSVSAVDVNGNTGTATASNITVDGSEPSIEVFRPIEGNVYNAADDSNRQVAGFQVDMTVNVQGVDNGAVVYVFNANGDPNNNATAIAQGTVSGPAVTVSSVNVSEGSNTLTVKTSDGINQAQDSVSFTVDSTPPVASLLAIAGDDGAQSGGRLLLNAAEDGGGGAGWQGTFTLELSGAQVGSLYRVFSDFPVPQTQVAQGVVGADAAHQVAITLSEASQNLTVSASDAAGNQNDPGAGLGLIVDITAPTLSISRPGNGVLLLVSGVNNAADEDDQEAGMQYTIRATSNAEDGQAVNFTTGQGNLTSMDLAGGTASGRVTLPEGLVALDATVADLAGNSATATTINVTVDSIAPVIAIQGIPCDGSCGDIDDEDADTAGLQVEITVTTSQVETNQLISLSSSVGGERCNADVHVNQSTTLTCTLLEGQAQILSATVSDVNGNSTTSDTVSVSVDLTAPSLSFNAPDQNPARLNALDDSDGAAGMQYTFVMNCDAAGRPVEMTVGNAAPISVDCDGASATFVNTNLQEGSQTVTATISDEDGNGTSVSLTAIVDTVAPTIEITTPAASPATYVYADDQVHEDNVDDLRLDTNLVVAVNGAGGGTVTVTSDQDGLVQTKAVDGDTDNVITDVRLTNQNHTLTLVATDDSGNQASATLVANVDVGKPGSFSLGSQVQNNRSGAVQVSWTEPGDDFATGTVSSYALRYSTSEITAANFGAATDTGATMTPQGAGQTMTVDLSRLPFDQTVYLAAQATDDAGNTSDLVTTTVDLSLEETVLTPTGMSGDFGWSHCAGDFNGDSRSDIVITDQDAFGGGAVWLVMGTANLATATADNSRRADAAGDKFGSGCTVADFNADGFDDLVVGSYSAGAGDSGQVYIYAGSNQGLAANPSRTINGNGGYWGYYVAAQGSFVGDETPDLAVSAVLASGNAGKTWVFDGDSMVTGGAIAGADLSTADAVGTYTGRAGSLSGLGLMAGIDFTGDGTGDLVVNQPFYNNNNGSFVVIPGPVNTDTTIDTEGLIEVVAPAAGGNFFGWFMAYGDIVGDDAMDIIAPTAGALRQMYVFAGGAELDATPEVDFGSPADSFNFASRMYPYDSCDLDGTGKDEILIGSDLAIYFWRGPVGALLSTPDRVYDIGAPGRVGICPGDMNLDGNNDIVFIGLGDGGSVTFRH